MKKLFLGTLLLCLSLTSWAQSNFKQPFDATECTNAFFKAMLDEDASTLNNLLTNDFSVVSMNGQTVNRDLLLQGVSKGDVIIESGMLSAIRSKAYGEAGIISGIWNVSAKIQNQPYKGYVSFLTACVREGGNWKITAVQFTPIR